jgi:DNA replication protein DnaC
MSDASVYRQLRSHLAYLRLTAISEVLAAELERAQHDTLSPTALLERLFAIEV